MKYKAWINNLISAVFAFALSVSAVGNLVTGYDLQVTSMTGLFLWCAFCALISAFLFGRKYGGTILLCLSVLVAPFIWKGGALWDQLQSLCYTISSVFHRVYGWPTLGNPISSEASLPMFLLSALVAVSVSWVCCCRKNVFIAIPLAILPLAICMITTDRVPDEIYLYLLILGVAMLLVTDWTRRNDPEHSVHLSLRLVIPVAVAFALLFAMNPQAEYANNAGRYQQEVMAWVQKLLEPADSMGSGVSTGSSANEKVNLRHIGPKRDTSFTVMRVSAPFDGIVYLRGKDYDIYTGANWESSPTRQEIFTSGGTPYATLTIATHSAQNILYVPYYSAQKIILVGGALSNEGDLKEYIYSLTHSPSGTSDPPDSSYTKLPSDTLRWALSLDIIKDTDTYTQDEIISHIKTYVENSAIYDLSTPRMGFDHDDFARWFLEESATGYCIHFASAATVLLRAAGIPARYVEGYAVACKAGEEVVVYSKQAHAWAEYYDFDSGTWQILETTPADVHNEEPEPTVSTEPKDTEPAPTEEPNHSEPATSVPQTNAETQPTVPDDTDTAVGPTVNQGLFRLPNWIQTVFWIMFAAALVLLQGYIRIGWKRKQWNRGKSNEKLITRWRQTKKIARIVNCPFPEELESLAQKAGFSQHSIRSDELQRFEEYRDELLETVHRKPWYQRILLHWVFAIGR